MNSYSYDASERVIALDNSVFSIIDAAAEDEISDSAVAERVARLNDRLPQDEVLYDLAELFRIFGDTTRIKILYALFESELCVGDLAQALNMSQSSVSHQLRVLKASKLVRFRRDGKTVFYSLDDDHVRSMIALGMEHVEE